MDFFSLPFVLLYAVLCGITMKVADLLNEHGLKLFRCSAVLFGILWGAFGVLLVFSGNAVANIILAMNVAFIIRNRLDCLNHQIAASMIIIGFLFQGMFDPLLFVVFYVIFLAAGGLKDYVNDVLKKTKGALFALSEAMLYYPVPTFAYCLLYGNWVVFYVFLLFTVSYDATKLVAARYGYK